MTATLTATEREIIALKAIWDSIGEMVNYTMFSKTERVHETELRSLSETHQKLFNILLVDFLSSPSSPPFDLPHPPNNSPKSDRTALFYLKMICDGPQINPKGAALLAGPLNAFAAWLEAECCVEKVWLPSISVETTIRLQRIDFIKICGNIGKHNFIRLGRVVKEISEILRKNGVTIDGN